jgi:hypothetical protein
MQVLNGYIGLRVSGWKTSKRMLHQLKYVQSGLTWQGNFLATEGQLRITAVAGEAAQPPCTHVQGLSTCWLLMDGLPWFFSGLVYCIVMCLSC